MKTIYLTLTLNRSLMIRQADAGTPNFNGTATVDLVKWDGWGGYHVLLSQTVQSAQELSETILTFAELEECA